MFQSMIPKLRTFWNSFRIAAWLGWQIESNWTDPFLFAIYSVIKPVSGAAILVVMYSIITQGKYDTPMFAYIFLGNAFYIYVGQIMNGIAFTVIDDREHYKTLKYIYTSPVNYPVYLLGRGVASFVIASIAVLITILFGVFFMKVPVELAQVNWVLFFTTILVGITMLAMMGLSLGGVMLLLVRHTYEIGGTVAGALFIFSGAVFPLTVLPAYLQPIGYFMPITYWLELLRRSMVREVAQAFPTLASLSNLQLMIILLSLTIFFVLLAIGVFRWCESIARERGTIDIVTNY